MRKEKKEDVIDFQKVLYVVAILALFVATVFTILELINGTPLLAIFTENWGMWVGFFGSWSISISLAIRDKKKGKQSEGNG